MIPLALTLLIVATRSKIDWPGIRDGNIALEDSLNLDISEAVFVYENAKIISLRPDLLSVLELKGHCSVVAHNHSVGKLIVS